MKQVYLLAVLPWVVFRFLFLLTKTCCHETSVKSRIHTTVYSESPWKNGIKRQVYFGARKTPWHPGSLFIIHIFHELFEDPLYKYKDSQWVFFPSLLNYWLIHNWSISLFPDNKIISFETLLGFSPLVKLIYYKMCRFQVSSSVRLNKCIRQLVNLDEVTKKFLVLDLQLFCSWKLQGRRRGSIG